MAQDGEEKKQRKAPRKATPKALENAALHYLERFASSAENLRRVLLRRVERSARYHDTDRDEGAAAVADIVERYRQAGLLDDTAYADGRARSLHRRGASLRAIRMQLAAKGVAGDDIDAAVGGLVEETGQPDLAAACAYARRRRLGPWRGTDREERRERDMAALARRGFSPDIARRVIDAETPEMLEEALEDGML